MGVERVTITALMYGQKMQNVLHFNNPDGALTGLQVCQEIRDNWIGTAVNVGIHAWCTQSTTWVQVASQTRAASPAPPTILTINQPGYQGANNEIVPFACVVLKFQTAVAGRRGRGRSYTPGVMPGMFTQGLMDDTLNFFGATALATMNSRYCAGGSGPLRLLVGPKTGIVLADFYEVTLISFSTFLGVQRRRNIGFGI